MTWACFNNINRSDRDVHTGIRAFTNDKTLGSPLRHVEMGTSSNFGVISLNLFA